MINALLEYLSGLPKEAITVIIAALPVVELRLALPLALTKLQMPLFQALLFSYIGNMIPVIPLLKLLEPVSTRLRRFHAWSRFFDWLFERTKKRADIVQRYEAIGLILLVAIPLPATGAWTGCIAASLFKIKFRYAFPAILLGVLIAGCVVAILTLTVWMRHPVTSDMPLKVCIALSAFLHISLFFPWSFLGPVSRPEPDFRKIELTYFRNAEIPDPEFNGNEPLAATDIKNKWDTSIASRRDRSDISRNEASKLSIPIVAEAYEKIEVHLENVLLKSEVMSDEGPSQSKSLREEYYLMVREKIKAELEKRCSGRIREGEVYVKFAIRRDGTLKDLLLYKSAGRKSRPLEDIAISSIKNASPFPPFDSKMKEDEILFRQPIQITYHR